MTINKFNKMNAENVKMYFNGEITEEELNKKGLEVLETILAEKDEDSDWVASHWTCSAETLFDNEGYSEETANLMIERSLEEAKIFEKHGYTNTVANIMASIEDVKEELAV